VLAHLVDGRQHVGGLPHPERRCRLIEDQHLGAEMHRARDRDRLALAARQRADRLVGAAQIDAHPAISSIVTRLAKSWSKKLDMPDLLVGSLPMKKFRADRHQRDHGQVLVDRGDTRHPWRRAGSRSASLPSKRISPFVGLWTPDMVLMKVDLPAPLSPSRQWHSPGIDIDRDAGQSDHRAEMLLDVLHLDDRAWVSVHLNVPP
jgi:hypothetical protein